MLKHFKWPEWKADAMTEAAIEYRDLKCLESEVSCCKDNANVPCGLASKRENKEGKSKHRVTHTQLEKHLSSVGVLGGVCFVLLNVE